MKTVGYFTVPVLETPDGDVIADSTEIMEYLEPRFPDPPMLPEDKPLAVRETFGLEASSHDLCWVGHGVFCFKHRRTVARTELKKEPAQGWREQRKTNV